MFAVLLRTTGTAGMQQLWSLTREKVDQLCAQREEKQLEHDELSAKTPEQLWLADLDALQTALEAPGSEV
mgnify:FL=1|jgi:hypothetical protein